MSTFIEITVCMKKTKKNPIGPQWFENDERKKLKAKGKPLLYRTRSNKCKRNYKIKKSPSYNYQCNNKWQKDDEWRLPFHKSL